MDVSKTTVDVSVFSEGKNLSHTQIENSEKEFYALYSMLKSSLRCTPRNSIICAENMGIYNTFLCKTSLKRKFSLYLESPLQIKKSLGIQRGKNDEIDSKRIAEYAAKNLDKMRRWYPPREILLELKQLSRIRARLVRARSLLRATRKAELYYLRSYETYDLQSLIVATKNSIQSDILAIEEKMLMIILSDERLSRLTELTTSVPRIDLTIAREIIIATNEFENRWTAKRFACYCGIAPFEYSSDTSVKGRTKVSHFANKNIKALLHLSAIGLLRGKSNFLLEYYHRKVNEGKNKMSVLNAIRNKLIHRIFSCVTNDKLFVETIARDLPHKT